MTDQELAAERERDRAIEQQRRQRWFNASIIGVCVVPIAYLALSAGALWTTDTPVQDAAMTGLIVACLCAAVTVTNEYPINRPAGCWCHAPKGCYCEGKR
jgi:hypothetical protein